VSNALFFLGLLILAAAAFIMSVAFGLFVVGIALVVVSLALADGKGLRWR
jgi:uncharacterized membrane protein